MFAGARSQLICALACTLLAASHATPVTVNMNHVCALVSDGTLLANPGSCDSYYYCQNGYATSQSCFNGYFFSKDSQQCLPQSMVNCAQPGVSPCSGRPYGSFVPVSGSCAGYYYCGTNGPERSNCPENENFDATNQKCVYNSQLPCGNQLTDSGEDGSNENNMGQGSVVSSINLCSYVKNGIYFGSADSCAGWNYCQNNVMTSGACSSNMEYNVYISRCDYPVNVNCSQVTMDPLLSGAASTYGGVCSTYGTTKAGPACNQYYYCNGNSLNLMQCPGNQYYDIPSGTCVSRLMARNNCDRCVGSKLSFVNSYSSTSCTGYLYCVNGIQQSSNTCNDGQYFNEIAGACVQTTIEPNFGCCNPLATGEPAVITTTSGPTTTGGSTTTGDGSTTTGDGTTTTGGDSTTTTGGDSTTTTGGDTTTTVLTTTTIAG